MKKLVVISTALFLFSCGNEAQNQTEKSEKALITYGTKVIETKENDCEVERCAEVKMSIPEVDYQHPLAQTINREIGARISVYLSGEENTKYPLDEGISKFFQKFKTDYNLNPEGHTNYHAEVYGEISLQNDFIHSLFFEIGTFEGGANGMQFFDFININPEQGTVFTFEDLIKDEQRLTEIAEKHLRLAHNVDDHANLEDEGFLINDFEISKKIGFDENHLIMVFHKYEIMPGFQGAQKIKIPLSELKEVVNKEW